MGTYTEKNRAYWCTRHNTDGEVWHHALIDILASAGEVRVSLVAGLALARVASSTAVPDAVRAFAHVVRRARPVENRGEELIEPQQQVEGIVHAQPALLGDERVHGQAVQDALDAGVLIDDGPEPHVVGRVARGGDGRAAGAEAAPGHVLSPGVVAHAEGGAGAGVAAASAVDQRRVHVAPRDDELVRRRQGVRPSLHEPPPEAPAGAGEVHRALTLPHDAYRAVLQEDAHDKHPPATVMAAGEQVEAVVAGEVEPWKVAARRPHAERVWHRDVSAGGVAAGHPLRRRRRRRHRRLQQCCDGD